MQQEYWIDLSYFSGVDQSGGQPDIAQHTSPDAQNVQTSIGSISTANGFVQHSAVSLSQPILSVIAYRNSTAGHMLIASTINALYYLHGSGRWELMTDQNAGGFYEGFTYSEGNNNMTLLTDGTRPLQIKVGNEAMQPAQTSWLMSSLCLHYERIWGAGDHDHPERVWFSKAYEPNTWSGSGTGFIDIPGWNGNRIIAVHSCYDEVVVCKNDGLYRICGTFPEEYSVVRVMGDLGPCNARSVVTCGDKMYFFNKWGICYYDGLRVLPLGDGKLKGILAGLSEYDLNFCCGVALGTKLFFAVPENGAYYCNLIIEYDIDRQSYMLHRGMAINDMMCDGKTIFAAGNDGHVYRWADDVTQANTPIKCYWTTPEFDLGFKAAYKANATLYAQVSGYGLLRVEMISGGRSKSRTFSLRSHPTMIRTQLPLRGRTVQLRFENENGSRFTIQRPQILMEVDED